MLTQDIAHPQGCRCSDFVHLHVHTDRSLLDGACRIDRLMGRAKALGMPAMALTDHGNLFGAIDFYQEAKSTGVKPLIGCELYLADGSRLERKGRSDEGKSIFHLGLLARNFTGYKSLLKLVSDAHLKGFYYKPRTDLETLARYADGLIGFTGCLASLVPQLLMRGDESAARRACARFVEIFGRENYFVEVQDHGIPEQRQIIPGLLKLAKEFGLKVVATNDVHYVDAADAGPHDAMLCIQTGSKLNDANRMRFSGSEFYLKTGEEMLRVFSEIPEAITNTRLVADMCSVEIPFPKGSERYPRYHPPVELKLDCASYLHRLCVDGLRSRYGYDYESIASRPHVAALLTKLHDLKPGEKPAPPSYEGLSLDDELAVRMAYEQAIINVTGFVDYFLVVWDFIHWAKQNGVPVGPGRGSGAGCLVAYLLGITNLDPIRFKLLFERFLNPERVSPPDFDIDFCMRRREEVINYVREKYGKDCVANIITYGTLGAKMVVRDLARVHDLPYAEADRLAKMIPDEINIPLQLAVEKSAELRAELDRNPVAKRIADHGLVLEGMVRNTGKHAAGIIITDQPLDEFVPLTLQENDVTVQFDMNAVGKVGLLKMDFLGLKTLTVIADAVENVRRGPMPGFDIDAIPLDDRKTYEMLNAGKTVGVFQLESAGMQNACKLVGVSNIDDINAICALYRPGPMQFIPDYARGKKNPSSVAYPHPLLEQSLQETYGIIVYQEQVMECAKIIAGYTLGGADMLRRAMGKKDADAMDRERLKFVAGAAKQHGIPEAQANEIFDLLNKFASYGFNKSHSAAYALLSYQTAYLKANYPVEFMAALLSSELGNADKLAHFLAEVEAMGIKILGPSVNDSRGLFTPVDGDIRFGLAAIKGVGELAAKTIISERERAGPFPDLPGFIARLGTGGVNRRVLEHLIKTGAFDFAGIPRKQLLDGLDSTLSDAARAASEVASGQDSFLDALGVEVSKPISSPDRGEEFAAADLLQFEKELLGFYLSGHPLDAYEGLVQAIDTLHPSAIKDQRDRTDFRLCGIATGITKRLAKKDNRPWAFFTFSTQDATVEMSMFADAYETFAGALVPNQPLVLLGNVIVSQDGSRRMAVKEVYPLEQYVTNAIHEVRWNVDATHEQLPDLLRDMHSDIKENPGGTRMVFYMTIPDQRACAVAQASPAFSWKLTASMFQRFRGHPALLYAAPSAKEVEFRRRPRFGR